MNITYHAGLPRTSDMPDVVRDVPVPRVTPRIKKPRKPNGPSRWVEFLKSLQEGDCFDVPTFIANAATVKQHLRNLCIEYLHIWYGPRQPLRCHGHVFCRFWIIKTPHGPIFLDYGAYI